MQRVHHVAATLPVQRFSDGWIVAAAGMAQAFCNVFIQQSSHLLDSV